MAMTVRECVGNPYLRCEVSVSVSGMIVTVGAASFVLGGEEYSLGEEVQYEASTPIGTSAVLFGYLVKERPSGDVMFLVDDYYEDGVDEMYEFTTEGTYERLHRLFLIKVPEGTTDLADADAFVYHIVPPLEEEEEEEEG